MTLSSGYFLRYVSFVEAAGNSQIVSFWGTWSVSRVAAENYNSTRFILPATSFPLDLLYFAVIRLPHCLTGVAS